MANNMPAEMAAQLLQGNLEPDMLGKAPQWNTRAIGGGVGNVALPGGGNDGRRRRRRRRRRQKQRQAPQSDLANIATSLYGKLDYGMGVPAEGVVPYGKIPENIRNAIPLDQPPIGWNPANLSPEELQLLQQWTGTGEEPAFKP